MMLVTRGARERPHEVAACLGIVPELYGFHCEQQRAIEGRLVERERGDAACLRDRRTFPARVRLESRDDARRDGDDREPAAPADTQDSRRSCLFAAARAAVSFAAER
jgi:hypothetical protein